MCDRYQCNHRISTNYFHPGVIRRGQVWTTRWICRLSNDGDVIISLFPSSCWWCVAAFLFSAAFNFGGHDKRNKREQQVFVQVGVQYFSHFPFPISHQINIPSHSACVLILVVAFWCFLQTHIPTRANNQILTICMSHAKMLEKVDDATAKSFLVSPLSQLLPSLPIPAHHTLTLSLPFFLSSLCVCFSLSLFLFLSFVRLLFPRRLQILFAPTNNHGAM